MYFTAKVTNTILAYNYLFLKCLITISFRVLCATSESNQFPVASKAYNNMVFLRVLSVS